MADYAGKECRRFMDGEGMLYESYDFHRMVEDFSDEMTAGLAGTGTSSLSMIPTYLSIPDAIPADEDVVIIDAGGTRLRRGLVRFSGPQPEVRDFQETVMPGTVGEVDKEGFLDELISFIRPLSPGGRRIGFCFSYPIMNSPEHDARVMTLTKELKIRGLEGITIGREFTHRLQEVANTRTGGISVLNDTAAVFLTGWYQQGGEKRGMSGDLPIGFILGTGYNCCYLEPNRNIQTAEHPRPEGMQLINTESGGFCGLKRGKCDEELDRGTAFMNSYILEKMTSGAYLGPLFGVVLRRAASSGLFGGIGRGDFPQGMAETTPELGMFLSDPGSSPLSGFLGSDTHVRTARGLAELLVKRSALVAAVPLAAIIARSVGNEPERNFAEISIAAEGSTLFRVPGYRDSILEHLSAYSVGVGIPAVRIREVKNGSLLGAGIAAFADRES